MAEIYSSYISNLVPIIETFIWSEIAKELNSSLSKCKSLAAKITTGLSVSDRTAFTPAFVMFSILCHVQGKELKS